MDMARALLVALALTLVMAAAVAWALRREGLTAQHTLALGRLQFPNRDVACRAANRRTDGSVARRCLSGDTTDMAATGSSTCVASPADPRDGACWQRVTHPDALQYMTTGGTAGGTGLDW